MMMVTTAWSSGSEIATVPVTVWAWAADADPAGEGAAALAALLAQLSFAAVGAFVDGVFPAGSGGRDGDRRAGLLVAAAERGLAAGGAAVRLPAGGGEDAAADRAGGRPVVVPRRGLGCGVRACHRWLRSPAFPGQGISDFLRRAAFFEPFTLNLVGRHISQGRVKPDLVIP